MHRYLAGYRRGDPSTALPRQSPTAIRAYGNNAGQKRQRFEMPGHVRRNRTAGNGKDQDEKEFQTGHGQPAM